MFRKVKICQSPKYATVQDPTRLVWSGSHEGLWQIVYIEADKYKVQENKKLIIGSIGKFQRLMFTKLDRS